MLSQKEITTPWRRSRLAARLWLKQQCSPLSHRERRASQQVANDQNVSNRLIEQAIGYLLARRK